MRGLYRTDGGGISYKHWLIVGKRYGKSLTHCGSITYIFTRTRLPCAVDPIKFELPGEFVGNNTNLDS